MNKQHILDDSSKHAKDQAREEKLEQEMRDVVIKVNYHFSSGFERHVVLQTPESILLNFLKKMITTVPTQFLYRISKKDFNLTMNDNTVTKLSFHPFSERYDWKQLNDTLKRLDEACKSLDYEDLKDRSRTLEKFFQVTGNLIDGIKAFKF